MFHWKARLKLMVFYNIGGSGNNRAVFDQGIEFFGDDNKGVWGQLDKPDPVFPQSGRWRREAGDKLVLYDKADLLVAVIRNMSVPPGLGRSADKAVTVHQMGGRQLHGDGYFEVFQQPVRLNDGLKESEYTLPHMYQNWLQTGSSLGWELCSSGSWSFAGGKGGRGGELLWASFYIQPLGNQDGSKVRRLDFVGGGGGFMFSGAGISGSDTTWKNWGTGLYRGLMPLNMPLDPEELAGGAQVVDLNAGYVAGSGGMPVGAGLVVDGMVVMFGVPYGLAVGGYKAIAAIAGPSGVIGTKGKSGAAVITAGHMTLKPRGTL